MFLEKLDHQAKLDPQTKSLLKINTSCLLLKGHMSFNSLFCPLHTHTHKHTHTHTPMYVTHLHPGNMHKQPLSLAQLIFISYLPGTCRHLSLSIIPCTFISLSCNVQYFGPVWCSLPCQGYFFCCIQTTLPTLFLSCITQI